MATTDVKYLNPVDIEIKNNNKYCRFKKMGIKYIDYKDADFLMRFLNDQGKILPRRLTGTSLKFFLVVLSLYSLTNIPIQIAIKLSVASKNPTDKPQKT